MQRILIFADSRWRDLPGCALLKRTLEQRLPDAYVNVVSYNYWDEAIRYFSPHIVIGNHIQGSRNRKIADYTQRHGGLYVVLFTEGILEFEQKRRIFESQKGSRFVDRFLCWSDETAQLVDGVVTGSPRFDFYAEPLNQLFDSPEYFRDKYGLNDKPIIAFGDSWPSSKFTYMLSDFHRNNWRELGNTDADKWADPDEFARRQHEQQEYFKLYILLARNEFSKDAQIVVKSHPMSDVAEWERWCSEHNVKLIHSEYIFNILNASQVYVTKLGSITVPEAWLVDTICVKMKDDYDSASSLEQYHANPWNAEDYLDVVRMIDLSLGMKTPARSEQQNDYCEKWGITPCNAAQNVANEIVVLLDERKPVVKQRPELFQLQKVIHAHDVQREQQRWDGFGNYDKAIFQRDVFEWQLAIDRVLNE